MSAAAIGSARRGILVLAAALALAGCTGAAATPETIYITLPTPVATPTPEPTATPEPTPSPSPTTTPSPTPSPTSAAAACTGTPEHQAYFAGAAKVLRFDIYCAVLPSGWWLIQAYYSQANGTLIASYKNNAGDFIYLAEGRLCDDLSTCLDVVMSTVGPASFGDRAGTLHVVTPSPTWGIFVNQHSTPGYAIHGTGMSLAQFEQIAAALVRVPRPAP